MRNADLVGTAVTLSGIGTGDYFVIKNSYVGFADTTLNSLDIAGDIIGIGTNFVDNIYQVDTATNHITDGVVGLGTTTFRRVTAKIAGVSTITFASTRAGFSSESLDFASAGQGQGGGGAVKARNAMDGAYCMGQSAQHPSVPQASNLHASRASACRRQSAG